MNEDREQLSKWERERSRKEIQTYQRRASENIEHKRRRVMLTKQGFSHAEIDKIFEVEESKAERKSELYKRIEDLISESESDIIRNRKLVDEIVDLVINEITKESKRFNQLIEDREQAILDVKADWKKFQDKFTELIKVFREIAGEQKQAMKEVEKARINYVKQYVEYKKLALELNVKLEQYNKDVREFNKKVKKYNEDVQRLNRIRR